MVRIRREDPQEKARWKQAEVGMAWTRGTEHQAWLATAQREEEQGADSPRALWGKHRQHPHLELRPPELGDDRCFKPPTLWSWVVAAPGKEGSAQRDQTLS